MRELNEIVHRLSQVERERRRRGVRDWPPLFEAAFASDVELEALKLLASAADRGDEEARAKVRVIVAAVNARMGRPDAPSIGSADPLQRVCGPVPAKPERSKRFHVHVPPVKAVDEIAAPRVRRGRARGRQPSVASPPEPVSESVTSPQGRVGYPPDEPRRPKRAPKWWDRDAPSVREMEF